MEQRTYAMPLLSTCCGLSLKFGTIFSGILGMLIGASTLIYILLAKNIKMKTIVIDTLPPEIVRIILAINLVMTVFISLLLVIGALKRNRWLMLPWVILAIMLAIGLLVSVIYTAVVFFLSNYVFSGCLWLVFGLISIAIFFFLWYVVFSYYKMIEFEKGQGPYARPPRR
uniref:Putative ABC transporter permease protein y4fN n=2 Tax=Lygus hesperus TaxID=30085 RepID=A0A0A9X8L7_LYGHE